jgi:hypothetical protein
MPPEEYCLGVEALGQCLATSGPLLSIGEALLVAGLLVAFYRWSGPLAQLRWGTRRLSTRVVLGVIAAAVALVFIAALLRLFGEPWSRVPVIGYPVFWELAGSAMLMAAGTVLAAFAFTRSALSVRNAEQYLAVNKTIIANGDEAALRELGQEIESSVPIVTAQCRAYRERERREGPAEADAYTRVCFSLLDAWSDERFCRTLVCWCPETVMVIVKALTEHAVHGDGAALGSALVNEAVADERSLLYREARKAGLRRSRVFLKAAFGEWTFVDSAVRPLASWNVYRDTELSERKIKRWGEAVDSALGAFMENGKHGEAVFRIRPGLEALNHVCAVVLARREQRGAPWSAVHDQIYEIASAFRLVVKRIRTCNLPAASETTIENYDPLQDETLHGAIAEELFHFIGLVCASDDHDFLDWITMGPWKELFEEGELTGNLRALQIRLAYHLTEKIDDNLDAHRRFPPPIMRMLLVRYPLSTPDEHPRAVIARELETYFIDALRQHFPALWKAHRAFAQSLLPGNTDYDEKRAVLRIRHPRRDTQVIALEKPTLRDSASEDVA